MPNILLIAVEFGGYISIVKFVIFLIMFFSWVAVVKWVKEDAQAVGANEVSWTAIVLWAGLISAIIWLLIPIFIIGMLIYLIIAGAASMSYVMHRNTRVSESEKVLTVNHLSSLFTNEKAGAKGLGDISFITANNNNVPIPEPKTADFFGYKIAHDLFNDAIWRRASDIVFLPGTENYRVAYIVDGAPLKQPSVPREQAEQLGNFLKSLANLDIEQKRKPQRGKFRISQEKNTVGWELYTAGSTAGEQIKLKQNTQQMLAKLSEIGFASDQYEQLEKLNQSHKGGVFIVSGPKENAVTTTFYALLRDHDAFLNSINTLERQPSDDLPNIVQNTYSLSDTGTTTFAGKLQSIIRMGPDIVGTDGFDDAETAKIICQAVKDGVLVYVTLEADSVVNAVAKWMKLVGDRKLSVQSLLGVSNQRIFRKLCENCKQAYEPNKNLLRKFNIPAEKVKVLYRDGKVVYDKRGKAYPCDVCQETGFVGRTCVFETVFMNDDLRKAILQAKSLSDISKNFRRAKMRYLQERFLEKVLDGTTSINEMVRIFSSAKKT